MGSRATCQKHLMPSSAEAESPRGNHLKTFSNLQNTLTQTSKTQRIPAVSAQVTGMQWQTRSAGTYHPGLWWRWWLWTAWGRSWARRPHWWPLSRRCSWHGTRSQARWQRSWWAPCAAGWSGCRRRRSRTGSRPTRTSCRSRCRWGPSCPQCRSGGSTPASELSRWC